MKPIQTRPCSNCPFRKDKRFGLAKGRTREFSKELLAGNTFHCHKTVRIEERNDGNTQHIPNRNTRMCAGAANMLIAMDRPNTIMQIAQRLGMWSPEQQDKRITTALSPKEWAECAEMK